MNKKEREWYSKMNGFYNSQKLKNLEESEEQKEKLR